MLLSYVYSYSCKAAIIAPPSLPGRPGPVVTGWQCAVDGKNYSGTVDTTFVQYLTSLSAGHPDTAFYCTGTTTDKGANLHLQFLLNRYPIGATNTVSSAYNQLQFAFDTCSEDLLEAFYSSQSAMQCVIDSFDADHLWAHFSGTLSLINLKGFTSGHTVTNGKLVAAWNSGDGDANTLSYTSDVAVQDGPVPSNDVTGYFHSARLVSNTLVLDGVPMGWSGLDRFRLLVRTGGTIQPGVYHSENGDVGLCHYESAFDDLYVTDSAGSLTINITKVTGNTVYGTFSGSNPVANYPGAGAGIHNGSFAVRVRGYMPAVDSATKWGFGAFLSDWPATAYHIYGGNVTGVDLAYDGTRYYLNVDGLSDHGMSQFVVQLSSPVPIAVGSYFYQNTRYPSGNSLDAISFASYEVLPWYNGLTTNLAPVAYPNPTEVDIDSISDHYVRGEIKGRMMQFTGGDEDGGFLVQGGRCVGRW